MKYFCKECAPAVILYRKKERESVQGVSFLPPYSDKMCDRCGRMLKCTIVTPARLGDGVLLGGYGPDEESAFPDVGLTLGQYQDAACRTVIYPSFQEIFDCSPEMRDYFKKNPPPNPYYPALGLAGEVGEICNKVKKIVRDHGGQVTDDITAALVDEIGDALWYMAMLCSELGLRLDNVAVRNLTKLAGRKMAGTLQGSGDKR